MSIDKKIDYVEQDGSLNFIKNSDSVTVPKKFKARKNAPATKLAYITDAEAKMLKKKKPGTPHKGPKGIPSYDSYGSYDSPDSNVDTGMSGVATSAAESGGGSGADRKELDAYIDYGSDTKLPPGVTRELPQDIKDYRNAFIAAGGGQRVNPGFFDSRNTVSPAELAAARAFNPRAFRQNRGGIMGLIGSGGILGNMIRGIGQRFGLGKKFDEPTYDMRGLFSVNPEYYNDFGNEYLEKLAEEDTNILVPKIKPDGTITNTRYPGENKNFYTNSFDLMSTGVQDGPFRKTYDYLEGDLYKDNTKRREPITFRSSYPNVNTGGILNTDAFISTDGLGYMDG